MPTPQDIALTCCFAVFFKRAERFNPPQFSRKEIVALIQEGKFFGKEPRYKPTATSPGIDDPHWLALEMRAGSDGCDFQFAWVDWNHVHPYSIDPVKLMAQGLLADVQLDPPERLAQHITDSTDAICFYADAKAIANDCREMVDKLKHFLAQRLNGVLLEPCRGFFDPSLQPILVFPSEARISTHGTQLLGKSKAHFDGMALSTDGTTIGTAGDPGNKASIWDAQTGQLLHSLVGHKKPSRAIAFSPDGTAVATGSVDTRVILWNTTTGILDKVLQAHSRVVGAVAFSPDGRLLASGGYDGTTIFWELPSGKKKSSISVHGLDVVGLIAGEKWHSSKMKPASVCSVAFSPDGVLLASGGTDGTVRIIAVDSGRLVNTFEGYKESAWPVAFSPDGKRLVAGSYDRKVRLWDVATGKLEGTFGNHGHYVFALAFSPDSTKLATGSRDTLIRIWDVATMTRQYTFLGHRDVVNSVVYFPDGKKIASASGDGTVRVWTID